MFYWLSESNTRTRLPLIHRKYLLDHPEDPSEPYHQSQNLVMATKSCIHRSLTSRVPSIVWDPNSPCRCKLRLGKVKSTRHGRFLVERRTKWKSSGRHRCNSRHDFADSRHVDLENGSKRGPFWLITGLWPSTSSQVPVFDPSGIGWLEGFDELRSDAALKQRCANIGLMGLVYPLHGRIGNLPADYFQSSTTKHQDDWK